LLQGHKTSKYLEWKGGCYNIWTQ